ncbi:TPA: hypothetical protein N0F65_003409 [Lagenidium giganteum]|uniref:Inositol-tetrakisphosphate 1-kinase n=1 Tax=Lagenidium giganteum TaxID=4803 RepID=A0AAV2YVP7_9STRA|nr:TPA: hypothetical protein N0F65_003409 [Lagenidium giganteum]
MSVAAGVSDIIHYCDLNMGELSVGVIFPAKKLGRLQSVLSETRDGVRFVLIDLSDPALVTPRDITAKYGRLDAVLHKLAHEMVFARLGDDAAGRRLTLMEAFARQHPHVKMIDPIASVQLLTDRHAACEMLVRLQETSSGLFNVPPFFVADSPERFQELVARVDNAQPPSLSLQLPLICKSVEACATDRSHMMSVVTKRSDLQYVGYPAIYQTFINHSGRLFKGYVLGPLINVAERRSLPNIAAGANHVHFNTQEQYPTTEDFHGEDHPPAAPTAVAATAGASTPSKTQEEILAAVRRIGEMIRAQLGLSLFGFDVIMADATGELFVIDVNYFPSYKELDEFDSILRQHIRRTCEC